MIETRNLTKTFDNFTAVDSLDLKIETGEFFGLLGPNGAGKTTTISLLSTLLLPTKGEILIDGQTLKRNRPDLKRKISVITQEYSMRQDMTMDEIMEYQGRLYFMPRKEIKRRTEELLEFCDLIKFRRRTVRKLSGGMKRKLMVCRALLTDPEILLLDMTWEFTGYNMLIFYSSLSTIPHSLYEAASIDGASEWQIIKSIKLPELKGSLAITVIFSIIGSFQLFNEPSILQNMVPGNSITTYYTPNMYAYNLSFAGNQSNYAAALAITMAVITMAIAYAVQLNSMKEQMK